MLRYAVVLVLVSLTLGCGGPDPHRRSQLDQQMFGPESIRIHPTFTQVRDWTGDGKPDGIEATLEIQDQFGEPTRATGRVMFEVYSYRKDSPEVRGRRIAGPWIFPLNSRQQQQEHWNSALRAYTFQLPFSPVFTGQYYVVTTQFDLNADAATSRPATAAAVTHPGRMFSALIIEPQTEERVHGHYRAPERTPGH